MRILIADDESIIRMGLKAILQELGHQVVTAGDGREALAQARAQPLDLAILDIRMPFTDGLQAAAALARSNPLPVLLLTAFSDQELIEKAAALPIHGYLIKPIRPEELQAAMAIAVQRFAEAQQYQARAEELAEALETRKLIDRAKGRLMASGMSEQKAFRTIQERARRTQKNMRQVALAILGQQSE